MEVLEILGPILQFAFLDRINQRDTSVSKSIFLFLIPYLGIILRPPMFLEFPISTSNLPKSWKMYHRRYWRDRQPILAKSPTSIGQITNLYWRIWQYIHINYAHPFCRHSEIANRYWQNHQPVLAKSPTSIGQIANRYCWNCITRNKLAI